MKEEKIVNLGYKYKLYLNKDQMMRLNHQMYIYNQAYNICLNLWQKENSKNKDLPKENRVFRNAVSYDTVIKRALRLRKLSFSTVVTQQARINFLKAVKKAFSKETIALRLKAIENATTPKEKAKALSNSLQLLSGLDGCRDTHTHVSSKFRRHKESYDKLSALRKALSVLISSGEILRHSKDVCTVLESLPRVPYSRVEEITKLKENTRKLQKTDSFRAFSAAKVNILSALPSTVSSRKRIAVLSKVENLYNGLSKSMKNKLQYAKVVNILHKLEKQIKNVTKLSHDLDTIKKLDASCKNIAKSNNILKVCKYKIKLLDDILISNVILYDSSSANYTALSNMQNACVAIKDAAYSLEKAKESLNNTLSDLETAKEEKKSFELALGGVCPFCHHLLEEEEEENIK